MAKIGYARVSTQEQNLDAQLDALHKQCAKVFTDKISGAKAERPGLRQCLDYLRPGDVLVITKFDRLARSLKDLIQIVESLQTRDIHIKSIDNNIDTSSPEGKFFFHVIGAMAEFERDLIRQRTRDGLSAARARGRVGGRKTKMTPEKLDAIKKLLATGLMPAAIAKQVGVSKATLYKHFPGGKAS